MCSIAKSQSDNWNEYPSTCDELTTYVDYVFSPESYILRAGEQDFYTDDNGSSISLFESAAYGPALTNDSNDGCIYFAGNGLIEKYKQVSGRLEKITQLNFEFTFYDAHVLQTGNIILITSLSSEKRIVLVDQNGNELNSISLDFGYANARFVINSQYGSYIVYPNYEIRTLDPESLTIGPATDIPGTDLKRIGSRLFTTSSYSDDNGLSWIDFDLVGLDESYVYLRVLGQNLVLLNNENIYISKDLGNTFEIYKHNVPRVSSGNTDLRLLKDGVTWGIGPGISASERDYISQDEGKSWTLLNEKIINIPNTTDFAVARNGNIFSSSRCGPQAIENQTENWQNSSSFYSNVKALPNDVFISSDKSVSRDGGLTWEQGNGSIEVNGTTCKQGIFFISEIDMTSYSQDNGITFLSIEHERIPNENSYAYTDKPGYIYFERSSGNLFSHDFGTDLITDLQREKSDFHIDLETSWSGNEVYILEYESIEKKSLRIYTSTDSGISFLSKKINIPVDGQNYKLIADNNGNLIIYNSISIFVSQNQGDVWLNLTPTNSEVVSIVDVEVSFDNFLYVSTIGTGILKHFCPLDTDLSLCKPELIDDDNDGYTLDQDCDDNNPNINPGQVEEPYNGLDDDCNAVTLDDDIDQDDFLAADDCNDNDSSINPNATDIPNNGIDEDCDGVDAFQETQTSWTVYPSASAQSIIIHDEFVAARNEKLFLSIGIDQYAYDPNTNSWSDFNQTSFYKLDVMPNDNLLYDDWSGYYLSKDLGATWNFTPYEIDLVEGVEERVIKNDIFYLTGFQFVLFSKNNGESFSYWQPQFPLLFREEFDLFDDNVVFIHNKYAGEDENFFTYDLTTDQKTLLTKDYDSSTHIGVATAWTGNKVFILEYRDGTKSEMLLQSSTNRGQNFTASSLPFLLSGSNKKIRTDQNGNIIIYDSQQIFISQNEGTTWIEITPDSITFESITHLVVSFDNWLYIGTVGSGILRLDCKLNADIISCPPALDDSDGDGYLSDDDCNDNDPAINPGAAESCNGLDDNCDGSIDEGLTVVTYYQDVDGDGYGNPISSLVDCKVPFGFVSNSDDCDDNNPNINPGVIDIPDNGIDEDCNGVDAMLVDNDGDGFFSDIDCDDNNPDINPAAIETCNGIDENCNGSIDEGLTVLRYYEDQDGDGYGIAGVSLVDCRQPVGYAELSGDCDDNNSSIHPGQTEAPYNGTIILS